MNSAYKFLPEICHKNENMYRCICGAVYFKVCVNDFPVISQNHLCTGKYPFFSNFFTMSYSVVFLGVTNLYMFWNSHLYFIFSNRFFTYLVIVSFVNVFISNDMFMIYNTFFRCCTKLFKKSFSLFTERYCFMVVCNKCIHCHIT